jgi:hypothetical protein
MRDNVLCRIKMLQEGTSYYNETKRAYYLQQYREKLAELDRLILNLTLGTAGGGQEQRK